MKDMLRRLGIRIYKLRMKKGLTQEELAEKASLTVQYIQKIESKKPQNLTIKTLEQLADALEVPISRLLSP